jgi:hypothetical protein
MRATTHIPNARNPLRQHLAAHLHRCGPRYFNIGSHKRISHKARTEWRRQLEAEATSDTGGAHG